MERFVLIDNFIQWVIYSYGEPFCVTTFLQEHEGCLWVSLTYLESVLDECAIINLSNDVQIELIEQ